MAGRPAQRVGLACAVVDVGRGRQRALRGPVRSAPRVRTDRTTAVGEVARGFREHAAQRVRVAHEHVRHHFVAPVVWHLLPVAMRFLQEAQVVHVVHGRDRRGAAVGRLAHVEVERPDGGDEPRRALGHFLRLTHLAARQVAARMVQQLFGMEIGFHRSPSSVFRFAGLPVRRVMRPAWRPPPQRPMQHPHARAPHEAARSCRASRHPAAHPRPRCATGRRRTG
jgi:hypothetical protein